MTFDPSTVAPPPDTLTQLRELGELLTLKRAELDAINEQQAKLVEFIGTLETQTLPQIMRDAGMEEIRLADGSKLTLTKFVDAKLTSPTEAFRWLREVGEDSIIKNKIEVLLDRGDDDLAAEIETALNELGVIFSRNESIHHSTLKSFVTQALEHEELKLSIPRQAFGVFEGQRVKYKKP